MSKAELLLKVVYISGDVGACGSFVVMLVLLWCWTQRVISCEVVISCEEVISCNKNNWEHSFSPLHRSSKQWLLKLLLLQSCFQSRLFLKLCWQSLLPCPQIVSNETIEGVTDCCWLLLVERCLYCTKLHYCSIKQALQWHYCCITVVLQQGLMLSHFSCLPVMSSILTFSAKDWGKTLLRNGRTTSALQQNEFGITSEWD